MLPCDGARIPKIRYCRPRRTVVILHNDSRMIVMIRYILTILAAVSCVAVMYGSDYVVRGTVVDAADGTPLAFASIVVSPQGFALQTDIDGRFAIAVKEAGSCRLSVRYVGYKPAETRVDAAAGASGIVIRLKQVEQSLREVTVTAGESQGMTSTSHIGRAAMEHLQPTSFADLMELLPGNVSKTPDMGSAATIALRETGTLGATGTAVNNADYAISSLGTLFMVDGAPLNSDANLQSEGTSTDSSSPGYKRNIVNRGVDMRSISTDNIETVEIVRGIPSAEYGNLTSGVVNIRRTRRATPFTARFKADGYSKLISAGKGLHTGHGEDVLNIDLSYLDSKVDPRNSLENYKRLTASARWYMSRECGRGLSLTWNTGADYTRSADGAKQDPDLNYNKIDRYKSVYNRIALTSELNFSLAGTPVFDAFGLNASASYEVDRLERQKQVAPQRASVAPTSMEAGVHEGHYLLGEYVADYLCDGRPLNLFLKARASGRRIWPGEMRHNYKIGGEWTMSKNYGRGQVYDLERPLSASWTTRPRRYSDIPSLNVLSFFAEDQVNVPLGRNTLSVLAGLRTVQLPGIDRRYDLCGKVYVDPRLNARWSFPDIETGGRPLRFSLSGGWGLTTKMPTVDYLYPQAHYNDFVQLNYYDVNAPAERSRVSLRTYIDDATNYAIRPARNSKWELRLGVDWGMNRLSVTYFQERMTDGFRYSTVYAPYVYTRYDATAIDPSVLTGPPMLENLPGVERTVLDGFRSATNGTRIVKRGVEFQLNTARWQALRTSLTVTGAWFRSTYSNSQMLYDAVSDVVGNEPVSDRYVGLYDYLDGRVNEQLNTNFIFDTQIPAWGLIFSTSVQCMWYVKTTRLPQNGIPAFYLDAADGGLHPFTEASASDTYLQFLVKHYNEDNYRTQRIPFAGYLNFKATKSIGRWMRLSMFVNRLIDWLPDYKSNGLTVRRASDSYFGMEAIVTI